MARGMWFRNKSYLRYTPWGNNYEKGPKAPTTRFSKFKGKSRGSKRRYGRRKKIPTGITLRRVVNLKTVLNGQHNPAAGTIGVDVIALNGGNDPGLAMSSAQPLYWDQYATMYRRYCVIGWKIKIEAVTSDNASPTVIGFCPLTTSTALANSYAYREVAGNKLQIMTPDDDKVWLYAKGSVKKFLLPGGGNMLSDDNLYALTSANPTNVLYGHIYTQAFDAAADPGVLNYIATLTQTIVYFDPVVPARS